MEDNGDLWRLTVLPVGVSHGAGLWYGGIHGVEARVEGQPGDGARCGAGPGVPGDPSMDPVFVPLLGSTLLLPGRFWFLSFSSLLHLARRLENQTCKD